MERKHGEMVRATYHPATGGLMEEDGFAEGPHEICPWEFILIPPRGRDGDVLPCPAKLCMPSGRKGGLIKKGSF